MFSFVYVCSMYACRCHSALLSHCFPSPFLVFPTCFLVFVVLFRFLLLLSFFFIILIGGARGLRMTQIEKLQASIAEWQVTRSGKKSNEIQFIYIYMYILLPRTLTNCWCCVLRLLGYFYLLLLPYRCICCFGRIWLSHLKVCVFCFHLKSACAGV